MSEKKKNSTFLLILILIVAIVGAAIVTLSSPPEKPNKIIIAGKDSFESSIAVEMIALELEELGVIDTVERMFNAGVTNELIRSLEENNIHLYPDYTGTFLSEIIKDTTLAKDEANHTYEQLNSILETELSGRKPYKILHPAKKVDSSYEMVMDRDSAVALLGDDFTLTALSKKEIPEWYEFGFTRDFDIRIDAGKALERVYGLHFKDRQTIFLHHSRKYEKLSNGAIQIADGYSTDEEYVFDEDFPSFVFLKDDNNAFPHYYLIPIVRKEVLEWYKDADAEKKLKDLMERIDLNVIAKITRELKAQNITLEDLEFSEEAQRKITGIVKENL